MSIRLPAEKPDKGKSSALPRVLILRNVDITDTAIFLEQILKVPVARTIGEVIHLQRDHPE
jgi:hypothetical protein